jgi:hypothetical protein
VRAAGRARPAPPGWLQRRPFRWWRGAIEAVVVYALYSAYELLRARVAGSEAAARHHAAQIVRAEQALGLFHEAAVQRRFLGWHLFIEFWDVYYGTLHFVGPALALFVLWRWVPQRYRLWRDTFLAMCFLAVLGFWLYPLCPPRFLPPQYGFVDTAAVIGGMGRLDSGSMKDTENLWAAMPSLHIGWSLFTASALWSTVPRRWRAVLAAYPACTLFAVVVTGNHYVLDGVGGAAALAAGFGVARVLARLRAGVQTRNDRLEEAVVG